MKRLIVILLALALLLCGCAEKKTETEPTTREAVEDPFKDPAVITLSPEEPESSVKEEKVPLEEAEGLTKETQALTTGDLSEIPMPEPVEPDTETADS